MKNITKRYRQLLVRKAIKEKNCLGFAEMHLLPVSIAKISKTRVLRKDQQLRSLYTQYRNRHFALFLLDCKDKKTLWAVWEFINKKARYRGYI